MSAAPAHATVQHDGCSLSAAKPAYAKTVGPQHYYKFTVKAKCQPGRSVAFTSQARQQNISSSILLGSWNGVWTNWKTDEVRTLSHTLPLNITDIQLYHRVRFRVTLDIGTTGSLSKWDVSPITQG